MTNRIASLRTAGSSILRVAPSSIAVCGLAGFPCKRSYVVSRFYAMVARRHFKRAKKSPFRTSPASRYRGDLK